MSRTPCMSFFSKAICHARYSSPNSGTFRGGPINFHLWYNAVPFSVHARPLCVARTSWWVNSTNEMPV